MDDQNGKQMEQPEKCKGIGVRHFQSCLVFGSLAFGYMLRVNMSVAVVAMIRPSTIPNIEQYDWDPATRSLILSSFFWGYVVAQLPAGISAQRYGPKIVLILSTAVCSLLTIIIPLGASLGDWKVTCFLRVLIGLCQGCVYPSVHTMLSKWIPKTERGLLSTVIFSGAQVGTVVMMAISGPISGSIGWPSLFYISGALSLAWVATYAIFGSDSPSDSKVITSCERKYIESLTGAATKKSMKTPWKAIFTSKPFIALIFAHCGFVWGFYTLLTEIPTYMNNVLNIQESSNGLLSALPYLAMCGLSITLNPLADTLTNRGCMSVEASRKIFNSIGSFVPMASLIALGYMTEENVEWAILLLTLAVGFNSATYVGFMVNHMDLAPNFAGTMMGISNGISNLLSIFAPLIVGAIVKTENDPSEWRIVFFITAGFYMVCNFIFIIFGKATVQSWN